MEATHDGEQGRDTPRLVTFVAQHKDLEGLNGIGIFAPFVTDERDLKRLGMDATSPDTGRPGERKTRPRQSRYRVGAAGVRSAESGVYPSRCSPDSKAAAPATGPTDPR